MMRIEEIASITAFHAARMGERWQASAVRACIPAPFIAASLLRSAWCRTDRRSVWPATMELTRGATAVGELAARGGGARFAEP